ncbi:MAG: hypothetical protein U1U88_002175 [Lawsonella clevelandensis]
MHWDHEQLPVHSLLSTSCGGVFPCPTPTPRPSSPRPGVLEDGEGNGCAITGKLPESGGYPPAFRRAHLSCPTRTPHGCVSFCEGAGGWLTAGAAAKEAGQAVTTYTKEQTPSLFTA